MRAFIAIPLPDQVKAHLKACQNQLKYQGLKAAWPRPHTLHLTLKFMGEISETQVDKVSTAMDHALERLRGFEAETAGIGVFPSVKKPRVIWAGVQCPGNALENLAKRLDLEIHERAGLAMEKRRFSAHLTLARLKQRVNPRKMVDLIQKFHTQKKRSFQVREVVLYRSELQPGGAVHSPLHTVHLSD